MRCGVIVTGRDKCEVRDRIKSPCERERQLRNIYLKSLGKIQGNTCIQAQNIMTAVS